MRLIVQRRDDRQAPALGHGGHDHALGQGRAAARSASRGRFGKRLLSPRRYRLVVSAAKRGQPRTATKRIAFRVVKG